MGKKVPLKDLIKIQYQKIASDFIYFASHFLKIQHPTRGRILFKLYDFQKEVLRSLRTGKDHVILKSRQMGISTLIAAYALWNMLLKRDYNVLVIATTQNTAKNLVTKVRVMYQGLPSWIVKNIQAVENNKLSLVLSNGSQIRAVSSNPESARSSAVSLLILDEFAFVREDKKIAASAYQTLATGGQMVVISTPNGVGNEFHRLWVEASEGGGMVPIKLHWSMHPDRDQTWRDEQTRILGEQLAAQECDCSFISSGRTVIDGEMIQYYKETHVSDPIEKRGITGDLWIWEYPDAHKSYIVSADVARGDGSDYSTFQILDVDTLNQVGEFRSKLPTRQFGRVLVAIATEYNNALLCVENAGVGWDTIQEIIDIGYNNLYYSPKQILYVDESMYISNNYEYMDRSKLVPGFTMKPQLRPLLVSRLQTYLLDMSVVINSERLLNELEVFIWNGQRPEARSGYNDDLIMAYTIGLWVRDVALRLKNAGIDVTKKALRNISKPVYNSSTKNNGLTINYGNSTIDISWLL